MKEIGSNVIITSSYTCTDYEHEENNSKSYINYIPITVSYFRQICHMLCVKLGDVNEIRKVFLILEFKLLTT